jgi:hypothetical protein
MILGRCAAESEAAGRCPKDSNGSRIAIVGLLSREVSTNWSYLAACFNFVMDATNLCCQLATASAERENEYEKQSSVATA